MRTVLVLTLSFALLAACGGKEEGNTAAIDAGMATVKGAVDSAIQATEAFNTAAAEAETPEQFAAALTGLAEAWGPAGDTLQKQILELADTGLDDKEFTAEVDRLDPALAEREKLFEKLLPKWHENEAVQAAMQKFAEANASWEK